MWCQNLDRTNSTRALSKSFLSGLGQVYLPIHLALIQHALQYHFCNYCFAALSEHMYQADFLCLVPYFGPLFTGNAISAALHFMASRSIFLAKWHRYTCYGACWQLYILDPVALCSLKKATPVNLHFVPGGIFGSSHIATLVAFHLVLRGTFRIQNFAISYV